jgi:hypothetical protein
MAQHVRHTCIVARRRALTKLEDWPRIRPAAFEDTPADEMLETPKGRVVDIGISGAVECLLEPLGGHDPGGVAM